MLRSERAEVERMLVKALLGGLLEGPGLYRNQGIVCRQSLHDRHGYVGGKQRES